MQTRMNTFRRSIGTVQSYVVMMMIMYAIFLFVKTNVLIFIIGNSWDIRHHEYAVRVAALAEWLSSDSAISLTKRLYQCKYFVNFDN